MTDGGSRGRTGSARRSGKELAKAAWRRLRGGELTPTRAAASVAVGLAVGVTPLWGLHGLIVTAICVPLRLDVGVAFIASNISLPFIAPFITFAELELGARILRGVWLPLVPDDVKDLKPQAMLYELVVGTVIVAAVTSSIGGAATHAIVAWKRARRAT